jgi:hypothetical protein
LENATKTLTKWRMQKNNYHTALSLGNFFLVLKEIRAGITRDYSG